MDNFNIKDYTCHMDLVLELKKYKFATGKTLNEIAREIGVTRFTVLRWLAGKNQPSPLAIEKLTAYMKGKEI